MNNIVNVYHVRDAYDHERGYTHHNTYTTLAEESIKEILEKHNRYVKSGDIGGYWIQVIEYEINGEHKVVDHFKITPQKTRIELNVKAKGTGKSSRKSMNEILNNVGLGNAIFAAPPLAPAADLWGGGNVVVEFEEDQEEHN
ncbi:hypothetical protein UFOVP128_70 [uncultured Caudovirales phage]|uniref:Uncharacterized protein n=1 Tax=uncultured Caudovirales phage TaxID=2100421 RepID=A0A6J5LDL9_9CAUD|nr:hypothetical protein UFOVP128_70 [uncultured Caudovirales phage]CAB5222080.1 hypothetical protein UFOVP243_49 [uncultured Caudovirales phage]